MAAMLVDRNNKIYLLWEFTAIFMQTMWARFLLFCPPTWRQCKPPITVNPRHAWPVFLKFERSFEIYLSVSNIANLVPRVLRLFGHRVDTRGDSGDFEKIENFLIGCSLTVFIVLPQKSCGNKIRSPQSLSWWLTTAGQRAWGLWVRDWNNEIPECPSKFPLFIDI